MTRFYVGCDLGQLRDYSAISVIERIETVHPGGVSLAELNPVMQEQMMLVTTFEVRHAERLPLSTTYPAVVERVARIMQSPEVVGRGVCVMDITGLGRPVYDMMVSAGVSPVVGVCITGGHAVSQTESGFNVPKRELVGALQRYIQEGRLKVAAALPDADELRDQMLSFRSKISAQGVETYEALTEAEHDDLVISVALPLWFGTRYETTRPVFSEEQQQEAQAWDPLTFGTR
jgi:hypothetical protein